MPASNLLATLATFAVLACVALVLLRIWFASVKPVEREVLSRLAVWPADMKAAVLESFARAQKADRKTSPYDLSAPLVMALVVPFVQRSADKLPRAFRKWDNNVSLNGDGAGWLDSSGIWHNGRDGIEPPTGTELVSYSDPRYEGDAYYAKGHHPRSRWARYVWLGLRNRASQLSKDLGVDASADAIEVVAGDASCGRARPGFFLMRCGDAWQYRSYRNAGPFCVIRNYGFKLEIVRNSGGSGRAAAVAIGRSLKGRR